MFNKRIAVHRFLPKRLQDHNFQGTSKKIALFGILGHALQFKYKIPICKIVFKY